MTARGTTVGSECDVPGRLAATVIVPAYQAATVIGACIAALSRQSIPRSSYEILVVDDGSSDATGEAAREGGADCVIHIDHAGPAAARNAGIAAARGDALLFTDADCIPGPEWIEGMLGPFGQDSRVVGVKGVYRTSQTALISRLVQLEFEARYQRLARCELIDLVDGHSAAYRRDPLVAIKGFDETYRAPSAEDVDLSYRMVEAGHRLVFAPAAWVAHHHPETLWGYLRRKARYGYWRALLYRRHPVKLVSDAHSDPWLRVQALLAGLTEGALVLSLVWWPALWGAGAAALMFWLTTLPFVMWAWTRDRWVALLWPPVTWLRVQVQGTALVLGGLIHRNTPLLSRLG